MKSKILLAGLDLNTKTLLAMKIKNHFLTEIREGDNVEGIIREFVDNNFKDDDLAAIIVDETLKLNPNREKIIGGGIRLIEELIRECDFRPKFSVPTIYLSGFRPEEASDPLEINGPFGIYLRAKRIHRAEKFKWIVMPTNTDEILTYLIPLLRRTGAPT
jgi:hypothetical protein